MRKILLIVMFAMLLVGCYEDYRIDYDYTTVAFSPVDGGSGSSDVLWRTVVKDEGLNLNFGVYLAGVIENNEDRIVNYTIDPDLLAGTEYEMMPESYYTLSDADEFIIPSGTFIGSVDIKLDSINFLNDPLATQPHYAIPFRITGTTTDSILSTHSTKILVLKYINKYHGYYDQEASYTTYNANGEELNQGAVENVINMRTTGMDTVVTDGIIFKGPDNQMKLNVSEDNSVTMEYFPNPNPDNAPQNIAIEDSDVQLATSYVAPWEMLGAINDGYEPSSSTDRPTGAYGNWSGTPGVANWVEYNFGSNIYNISQSDIYWWTDNGGIQIPNMAYMEYWDLENEEWVRVDAEVGLLANQYNTTELSITTNRIRMHFNSIDAQGILEWKVWGTPVPTEEEQSLIQSITVLPGEENSYDHETSTYTLNYRIDYVNRDFYTIVSTELIWRNRIRDGVNEWRR